MSRKLLFLLLYGLPYLLVAQTLQIDSLRKVVFQLQATSGYQQDTIYLRTLQALALKLVYSSPDSTILLGQEVARLSHAIHYQRGYMYGLYAISMAYRTQGKSPQAVPLLTELLELATTLNDKLYMGRAYNQLGSIGLDAGKPREEALKYYQKALKIRRDLGNHEEICITLHNIALTYKIMGDYTTALRHYLEVLTIAEQYHFLDIKGNVVLSIGQLYAEQQQYQAALPYLKQAQSIYSQIGNLRGQGVVLNDLGDMFRFRQDYTTAEQHYQQSLAIRKKIDDKKGIAYSYSSLAKNYQLRGQYHQAVEFFVKAIALKDSIQDISEQPQDYTNIGSCFLILHDYPNALQFAQKGLFLAKRFSQKYKIKDCCETLSKIHKTQHRYDSALFYYELFKSYADSLKNQEITRTAAQLHAQYDFEKQAEVLRKAHEYEKKMHQWVIFFVLILLLFALILVVFIYHSRSKLQRSFNKLAQANEQIQAQKEELMAQAEELDIANQTKSKLFAIIGHDLRSPIASLQGLLQLLMSEMALPDEFLSLAKNIEHHVNHVYFTLNNLLSWATRQLSGITVNPQRVVLQELITENFSLFSDIATQKNIMLYSHISQDVIVYADHDQINVVFRNLLSNAIKFSREQDQIHIKVHSYSPTHYQVAVQDTGIGMLPEMIEKIFYTHLTTQGTAGERGTGLGLALCKDFIEKNRGTIWIESKPQQGTTFYFTLLKWNQQNKNQPLEAE